MSRHWERPALKAGRTFSLDLQMWALKENLYLRHEHVIVLAEDGYENLSDFSRSS